MRDFILMLLTCSATMSALGLIYMAIAPLLARRYSEKGRYYAWLIILFGLIVPFRPHFDNSVIKIAVPDIAVAPAVLSGDMVQTTMLIPADNTAISTAPLSIPWWQIVAAVWLAGMIAFLAYHLIKHYRFMKMARRWSESITEESALNLLRELKTEMGITKSVSLYLCSSIGSPMMIGYRHPRILLPKSDISPDELRFILKHELIHLKRKDLWYKILVLISSAMHWFNPAVYLIARAIDAQCELSCDAEVVCNADADTRQYYSETIISVVKCRSKLKTALSTNFYGGKNSMKKRILSIMDTGKKRTGIAIACVVLIATIGTGFAFAANVSPIYANNDSSGSTTIHDSEIPYDAADKYGKYAEFGLTLDMTSGNLYYNGELIRYFEDWYPISEDGNAYAGIDYFNEHGTIDAHGVRNLTKIVRNTDGSYDPSGVLIGVEPYSQAEFDARDIDKLKNPPQNNATAVSNSDYANGIDYRGASNFILSDETAEEFKVYAEFGLTYDDDDVFRYQGKTVRRFIDLGGVLTFTRAVPNDYDKSVDLTAVRDMSGKLTGISQASREEFEERTKQIVQSQKEQEEFLKNHPNVTAYSTNPTAGSEPGNSTATAGTTYCIGQETSNRDSATSNNHDFVDTSLNDYIDYGVSYDNVSKAWVFNGKSIYFLLDSGHQVYLNFREDNTSDDFADKIAASNGVFIKVLRNSVGSIDKIIEMTVEEAVNAISNLLG